MWLLKDLIIVAMVVVGGAVVLENVDTENPGRVVTDWFISSGGGAPLVISGGGINPRVVNQVLCLQEPSRGDCSGGSGRDVYVYWEVQQGIGCCATNRCDYSRFFDKCIQPEFKLYDISFDGVMVDWSDYDWSGYDYVCQPFTPWNWYVFSNVSDGAHSIEVLQKECSGVIKARFKADFVMNNGLLEGVVFI